MFLFEDEIWSQLPSERRIDRAAADFAIDAVRDATREREQVRVLDLGCGEGQIAAALADLGARVTGVDVSQVALERARAAHPELDFTAPSPQGTLPFPDAAFDVIVCLHVLQHVADTQRFLSEARRVLLPAGHLAVAVPWHGLLKNLVVALRSFERHYDPLEPVLRFYTRRSLAGLLRDFGFDEVRTRPAGGRPILRETLLAGARRGSL
jgi:2-polyprenyl-3-methyl-5-hydroxy-6-metoxy-1,4-benzoquinol methylase